MKKRTKLISGLFLLVVTVFMVAMYVTTYMTGGKPGITDFMVFVLLLTSWFQFFTWGGDAKAQKDELGQRVSDTSAKLSYFILTGSLFVLWIIDRMVFVRKNEFGNVTLFVALCLAMLLYPVIQFILSRKYR